MLTNPYLSFCEDESSCFSLEGNSGGFYAPLFRSLSIYCFNPFNRVDHRTIQKKSRYSLALLIQT